MKRLTASQTPADTSLDSVMLLWAFGSSSAIPNLKPTTLLECSWDIVSKPATAEYGALSIGLTEDTEWTY